MATDPAGRRAGRAAASVRAGTSVRAVASILRAAAPALARGARRLPLVPAVTGLGWVVIAGCLAGWAAGTALGWTEFELAARTGLGVVALCVLLMIGRTRLDVTLRPERPRMKVGESVDVAVTVTNNGAQPLVLVSVEVPIGDRIEPVALPITLLPHKTYPRGFRIDGQRRGVVAVGPATSVRGDPFGLLRRDVRWTDREEIFVHPRTVRIDEFGVGLLHDLEGRTTEDMSMSDLAFHTLRPYVPGDDRRFIHWPSSAKLATIRPEGTFLVRQFRDTRRTHALLIVDGGPTAYADADDFETAISVGASIAVQTVRDNLDATMLIADQPVHRRIGRDTSIDRVLDICARAGIGPLSLDDLVARGAVEAPATTFSVIITGAGQPTTALRRMTARLPRSVRTIVICVDPYAPSRLVAHGDPTVATIATLDDLRAMLRRGEAG